MPVNPRIVWNTHGDETQIDEAMRTLQIAVGHAKGDEPFAIFACCVHWDSTISVQPWSDTVSNVQDANDLLRSVVLDLAQRYG